MARNTLRTVAHHLLLVALPMTVAFAALLVWGGREFDLHSMECRTAWCQDRDAYIQEAVTEIIQDQVDQHPNCTRTPHWTETVLTVPANGRIGDGVSVVSEMSMDEAWTKAEAGEVSVLAWCD